MKLERDGKRSCSFHVWVWDTRILQTHPKGSHKICAKCGRIEQESGKLDFSEIELFEKIFNEFWASEEEGK